MSDAVLGDTRAFVTFVAMSGISAGVNVAACWVFACAVSYPIAVALSYLCGMATAFTLVRIFVFRAPAGGVGGQFLRFALVNAVSFAQVLAISLALARMVFPAIGFAYQAETVAHVIGVGSLVATSYLLHKRFSFREAATRSRAGCVGPAVR